MYEPTMAGDDDDDADTSVGEYTLTGAATADECADENKADADVDGETPLTAFQCYARERLPYLVRALAASDKPQPNAVCRLFASSLKKNRIFVYVESLYFLFLSLSLTLSLSPSPLRSNLTRCCVVRGAARRLPIAHRT